MTQASLSEFEIIRDNHHDILSRIDSAAKDASINNGGNLNPKPKLVAVSKVQSLPRVQAALDIGQSIFGENRVQEAQQRWGVDFVDHRASIELRLIGPLQSNKAEDAVALFDVIETLDREKLFKALVKAADKTGRRPRLYIQVNTGEEPQKSGLAPHELAAFVTKMRKEYEWEPEGLMCIPPQGEAASAHFWLLSNLAKANGIKQLSMGMSADYEIAVKMGASSVRIGSALFGVRGK